MLKIVRKNLNLRISWDLDLSITELSYMILSTLEESAYKRLTLHSEPCNYE